MPENTDPFEQKLKRLQEIVTELEKGDTPLEQGVALFKEGSELAKDCRKQLKEAQHKVEVYSQGILKDFDLEQDSSHRGDDEGKD